MGVPLCAPWRRFESIWMPLLTAHSPSVICAQTSFNAKEMIRRLQEDLVTSADELSRGFVASMKMLHSGFFAQLRSEIEDESIVDACAVDRISATHDMPSMLFRLDELISVLQAQRERDTSDVVDGTKYVVELANSSSLHEKGERERLQFQLRRTGGQRCPLHFEYIAAAVLSSRCAADLQRLNPLLDRSAASHELPKACASILLKTIRLCQVCSHVFKDISHTHTHTHANTCACTSHTKLQST